jgi:hypothetical protein
VRYYFFQDFREYRKNRDWPVVFNRSLFSERAASADKVSPVMLKSGGPAVINWLLSLFRKIQREMIATRKMLKGVICPIFKACKQAEKLENRRPVTVLSAVRRLVTSLISDRRKTANRYQDLRKRSSVRFQIWTQWKL